MNGEEFYESFKAALNYLGLAFHQMSYAEVRINGDSVELSFDSRQASFSLVDLENETKRRTA